MAHVSHKLSSSLQGALAGGGDPATSPLYVFGPFLRFLVAAGVAQISFGASIWLAVITVVAVSAMYRRVMIWVTDGSGGSGLNEEEFGPWAVKVNAGITLIEYTLTFLVSMAALVTFLADRVPQLNARLLGLPLRTLVASILSVLIGFVVNRGPKMAVRAFGPATAAVLLLLWGMIVATVFKLGLHLPAVHLHAFASQNVSFTLGGYARILALMTGVEIFANLVVAYDGPARTRSRRAFGSLLIVMSTTSLTMLIVGPAIQALADPSNPHVSVFTQTMDRLLPAPVAYMGTLIGIAVLLSAAAASVQGIQNLALGLRYRHYIPASLGQRNRFDVADRPVWVEVGVCIVCFVIFGTHEETFLALYAAGVFVLLSLTGWAAVKRLGRELRAAPSWSRGLSLGGAALAALLTSTATVLIFAERFRDGAWVYLFLVPALYLAFGATRRRLGVPSPVDDRLGRLALWSYPVLAKPSQDLDPPFRNILLPLDTSPAGEVGLAVATTLARSCNGTIHLLTVLDPEAGKGSVPSSERSASEYLSVVSEQVQLSGIPTEVSLRRGDPPEQIGELARSGHADVVVMRLGGRARWQSWFTGSVTSEVIYQTTPPLLVLRPTESWRSTRPRFGRLLVTLDGSETAEQVLPYASELASRFGSEMILLCVPENVADDTQAETLRRYLERIQQELVQAGVRVRSLVTGSAPVPTILRVATTEEVDLIMMVSHGQGGVARQTHVKLGSVVVEVLQETPCPVFLVSALPSEQRPIR